MVAGPRTSAPSHALGRGKDPESANRVVPDSC